MSMRPMRNLPLFLALGGSLFVAVPAAAETEEIPGVARVSLIEGEASYFRRDGDDWSGVDVNAPLVTGDRLFSGAGSRAEVQLAPGVYARLGAETELDLVEIGPGTTHVQVPLGRASFRVRRDPEGEHIEIDTPAAALVVRRRGVYRVEVSIGGRTVVRVHQGELVAHVAGARYTLGTGGEAVLEGVGDDALWRTVAYAGTDAFDDWERSREARVASATSYRYVSEDIYGAEDLDEHGNWEYRRGYGYVWRPRYVPAGWGPYSTGRWLWVDPWGWTWLDAAVWGWAPFHYGRWVYLDSYWYWAPGPVIARPIYAPALVGWYGYGLSAGVSVGIGFGPALGWVALGWGEPCFPWWGGFGGIRVGAPWWGGWGGPRIINNVYVDNRKFININARDVNFVNRGIRGGFSTLPVRDFTSGRGGRVPIGFSVQEQYTPIEGRLPIGPSRESRDAVMPTRRGVAAGARPPMEAVRREIVRAPGREAAGRRAFASAGLGRSGEGSRRALASAMGERADSRGTGRAVVAESIRSPLIAPGPRAPRPGAEGGGNRAPFVARRPVEESGFEGIDRGVLGGAERRSALAPRREVRGAPRAPLNGGERSARRSTVEVPRGRTGRDPVAPGVREPSGRQPLSTRLAPDRGSREGAPPAARYGSEPRPRLAPRSDSALRPSLGGRPPGRQVAPPVQPELRRAAPAPYRAPSGGALEGGERLPSRDSLGRSGAVERQPRGFWRGSLPPSVPSAPSAGTARQSIGSGGFGGSPRVLTAPAAPSGAARSLGSSGFSRGTGRSDFSGMSRGGGIGGAGGMGGGRQSLGGMSGR